MNEPVDRHLDSLEDEPFTGYSADDVLALACANPRGNGVARKLEAFSGEFAPNLAMWRYMVASAWQDALKRGDIETVCVRGEHLRHGDKFTQKYTGFLYRLLEPVKSGIAHDEREFTVWRVVSLNTPKAAVLEETIYDCAEYRVVKE